MKLLKLNWIACLILFSSGVFSQQLDYELKLIDLNTDPAFEKGIEDTLVVGDIIYMVFRSNGFYDLLAFDGTTLDTVITDTELDLFLLGELNNGILVRLGGIADDAQYIFFVEHGTNELTQLHEFQNEFRGVNILEDFALIVGWDEPMYVTDGTVAGTQEIGQFSEFPTNEEFQYHLNGLAIFIADGEVWRSDGTTQGTYSLSDFEPQWASDRYFFGSGDLTYYTTSGSDILWKTDGTVAGTQIINDVGVTFNSIRHFVKTDDGIMFVAETVEHGREIWVSDGTQSGTQILLDLVPGPDWGMSGTVLYIENEELLVFGAGGPYSHEVWKTDGTLSGTHTIIDFSGQPGYDDYYLHGFYENANGKAFFITQSSFDEKILWAVEESPNEAVELATLPKLISGYYSSGSKMYFDFYEGGEQLWVTDGTVNGTNLVNAFSFHIDYLGTHDNLFYFTDNFDNSIGDEPFVSDGSPGNFNLLKDINPGNAYSNSEMFFIYNNEAYFYTEDGEIGQSIYTTDGTENGTQPVFDLYPNTAYSDLEYLIEAAGKLYFLNEDTLWVSDGTKEGSFSLQVYLNNNSIYKFGELNDKMLFRSGVDMWVTDGTVAGTHLLLAEGATPFYQISLVKMGDKLWFFYDDGNHGIELYQSDGTVSGTGLAFESIPGEESLFNLIKFDIETNGEILFFANFDDSYGEEVWISDGTLQGTNLLKDITSGETSFYPDGFTRFNDKVCFYGYSTNDLYISDGTETGTVEIGNSSIDKSLPTVIVEDNLYFISVSREIWKTDGTEIGTQFIFGENTYIYDPTKFQDKLIFSISQQPYGWEPWITNGTEAGTGILKDISSGGSSNPNDFTRVEDVVLFTADASTKQIWQTDGNENGTIQITDYSYDELYNPEYLNLFRGNLYFIASNSTFGEEIYYLDFNISENIKGHVYHDSNSNGEKDLDEIGINNIPLVAVADNGDEIITYTDADGNFEFYTDEGDYEVSVITNQCWGVSSDPTVYEVSVDANLITGLDFGLEKVSDEPSVWAKINSAPSRCGFTVPFWINIANNGCDTISGEIEIVLDNLVDFVSSVQTPISVNGNILRWDFNDIVVGDFYQIQLDLLMPDEQYVDEQISIPSSVYLLNGDNELELENEGEYTSIIQCAIDPNDKLVSPDRTNLSDENYTLFDERLTYTIRFQNTGTDTAFTVKIRDTLSPLLDLQSFEPLAASHSFRTTIYPGRVVEFLFEDILLPDSTINEPESHGFVIFEINTLEGIDEFSELQNTAHIYFDYNGAVVTNTATSTLVSTFDGDEDGFFAWEDCDDTDPDINPDAVEIPDNQIDEDCDGEILTSINMFEIGEIEVFPNPTTGRLNINLYDPIELKLKLSDTKGKILKTSDINTSIEIDLKSLPSGVYFLELNSEDTNQRMIQKIIKIE